MDWPSNGEGGVWYVYISNCFYYSLDESSSWAGYQTARVGYGRCVCLDASTIPRASLHPGVAISWRVLGMANAR